MENHLNNFKETIERLKARIQSPLPGWEAQRKMASLKRLTETSFFEVPENARIACVLVLLYPDIQSTHTVFIQRNEYDGVHSGQISFPGGQQETVDRSHSDTALREAWEETGINPKQVEIIGELTSLYIPPSNFLVHPILGFSNQKPLFKPDPAEVQKIIEVDLEVLKDPGNRTEKRILIRDNYSVDAPCYHIGGQIIWGATAMILSELLEISLDV